MLLRLSIITLINAGDKKDQRNDRQIIFIHFSFFLSLLLLLLYTNCNFAALRHTLKLYINKKYSYLYSFNIVSYKIISFYMKPINESDQI